MDKPDSTSIFPYAAREEEEILRSLGTSLSTGLSSEEAADRALKHGLNEITARTVPWWEIAGRQFTSPFIYLLLIAALIVFLIGEAIDAAIIVGFVFINAGLGFYQEYKSERALRALQEYISPRARVRRDGEWKTTESKNLTPGDIISLATGDAVPADVRVLSTTRLVVNETTLTGESVPVPKESRTLSSEPKTIYESHNLCFSGTTVVEGEAVAVVLQTGSLTTMGRIARLTVETEKESEFSRGIARFSRFILRMIVITLIFIFIANLLIKGESANIFELVVFCIALVVSVVPEALPVVTTVSLSRGALELAKHEVIVKRLTAIEDIGSIEVLCSDKTGTLTENRLTVTGFSPGSVPDLIRYASLTVAPVREKTEPFDIAIDEEAGRSGIQHEGLQRIAEIPFDPVRRRNAVLLHDEQGALLVVRGAPEVVMDLASSLTPASRQAIDTWVARAGTRGERTIAIATRRLAPGTGTITYEDERDLDVAGVISFTDPIKPSTFRAVSTARELGVSIRIITGDSPGVAGAVGTQIGLIDDPSAVLTGTDLQGMSAADQKAAIMDAIVIARVTPEQKFEIIETLQERYITGFLGEGINDAPALKRAGVSMVVQSAADIAREAADIILLQQDLEVIVKGIRTGRAVFANSVKYLKATLASNFGHFYAIAIGSLFISFLPMLPLQILLVNLLSDFPMISIATDTVDRAELSRPRRYDVREIVLAATTLGIVVTVFDLMFFAFFFQQGDQVLQTNWFIGSILTELVFLFSIRTRLPFYQAQRPSGYVLGLTGVAIAATLILPFTALGQTFFHFVAPSSLHLGIIIGLVAAFFICAELVKAAYYRFTG